MPSKQDALRGECLPLFAKNFDRLKSEMRIGVVYSGDPHDPKIGVSRTRNFLHWKSYKEVAENIATALYGIGVKDAEIVAEGQPLLSAIRSKRFDYYWLNTGGVQGLSPTGHASALLEGAGVPYYGHSPLQTMLLDDKVVFKQWLRGAGLPTPPAIVRHAGSKLSVRKVDQDYIVEFGKHYEGPFVVKPANGRGSVFVIFVDSLKELNDAIEYVYHETSTPILVEKYLPGREFCIAGRHGYSFLENGYAHSGALAFAPIEIVHAEGEKISQFVERGGVDIGSLKVVTAQAESVIISDLSYLCRSVIKKLNLRSLVRFDIRQSEDGAMQILECNPKPDLLRPSTGRTSIIAFGLDLSGTTYSTFFNQLFLDNLLCRLEFYPESLRNVLALFDEPLTEVAMVANGLN
jgi:D-alanine-D-alanine ligase